MIRIGVIGCGGMADTHAARFKKNAVKMRVTAAVDVIEERARAISHALGTDKAATDFRDILNDVDAVLLAVPHHLHYPIGMECIHAGKHVLMEKPLANTEEQCLELLEAAEKQGVILMVAYCMRYHPLVERMKELITEKKYGDTFHASIWTEQFTRYSGDGSWAHKIATLGGGQLFSHGCHYVDILLDWLGDPVEGTHTGTNFGTPWMEREGTSDIALKFASGAIGYHSGTWGARGTRLSYTMQVHGTEGFLEADLGQGTLTAMRDDEEILLFKTEAAGKHVEGEMAHFLECIEQNKQPLTDARSSLQSLRVIWRLYEAEEAGKVADLRGLGLNNTGHQLQEEGVPA